MNLYGIDLEKATELQELAKKLEQLPRDELLYISGRADAYADIMQFHPSRPPKQKPA